MALDSSFTVNFAPFIISYNIYYIYTRWASLLRRTVDGVLVKALCVKRCLGKSRKWKGGKSVYLSLLAEQKGNDCVETKRSCSLHIRLGALYKRVALGRIRCFCLSQVARDVQQVQETTKSPLRPNGLQAADFLPHVREEGMIAN